MNEKENNDKCLKHAERITRLEAEVKGNTLRIDKGEKKDDKFYFNFNLGLVSLVGVLIVVVANLLVTIYK